MSESIQPTSAAAAADDKLDFKKILPIFVIVLIDLLGLTIIIPLLPLYAAAYGATAFQIGLLGATYPIFQFIGAPILGRLSDRYGRRPVLLVSQVGTLIGFLILGFAPACSGSSSPARSMACRAATSPPRRLSSPTAPTRRPAPRGWA